MGALDELRARMLARGAATRFDGRIYWIPDTRPDAVVHVVGEYFRQAMVRRAERSGATGASFPGVPAPPVDAYKAILARDREDRRDPNAVSVALYVGGEETYVVGRLSHRDSSAYRPVFEMLVNGGLACDATLVREGTPRWSSWTGVRLNLETPGEIVAELHTDDYPLRSSHEWRGQLISFADAGRVRLRGVPLDRPAQVKLARMAGIAVEHDLTERTRLVVAGDPRERTPLLERAKVHGIEVVPEVDFWPAVGVTAVALGDRTRWARLVGAG